MRKIIFIIIGIFISINTAFGLSINGDIYEGDTIKINGSNFGNSAGLYGKIVTINRQYKQKNNSKFWDYFLA